ncbi:MAG TPA: CAP domain-containing protein [Propionicimonas sp.]|uniref:CAP domain-containing protein n=1 Tax=Propionicimonas sp. TaxID=1955623 RepID=UPI002F413C9C
MRRRLLRHLTAIVTGLALAMGFIAVATVPAQAASFSLTISASAKTVVLGKTVTFTGKVSPKPSSRTLYLQRRYVGSSTWTTVKTFTAASSGSYKVSTGFTNDRDRHYRVYKPKSSSRKAGYSSGLQVIVDARPTGTPAALTSVNPAVEPLSGGAGVTVTGAHFTGTTKVTVTPQVPTSYTAKGDGVFPELTAGFTVTSDTELRVTPPASLAGTNLVKVYTPTTTATTTIAYTASTRAASAFEKQVLDQVNLRRGSVQTCNGKPMPAVRSLTWDGVYADLALSHAKDLAARQGAGYSGLSHTTYGLKDWSQRFSLAGYTSGASEDLALSPVGYSASQVVQQWMNSTSGHCESVMDGHWSRAGIGAATGLWGSQSSLFTNLDLR